MANLLSERPLFVYCGVPLVLMYSLNFILTECPQFLGLVTANTLITHTYAWNLLTSCFYEENIVKLLIDLSLLFVLSKHVGTPNIEQFGLYFIFSILSCTIGTSIICFIRFIGSGLEYPLIVSTYGFNGILMSLIMFTRQILKSQPIAQRFPNITYHHIPAIFLIIQLICTIAGVKFLSQDITFTFVALLFSWSYLKFYYKYSELDPPGDKSDDFSFVGMFPEAAYIVLVPFTTAFYNIMVLLGLFPPLEPQEKKLHHHLRQITPPTNNNTTNEDTPKAATPKYDIVAERRKAKAMKILDAKMAELSKEPEGWDDVAGEADALEAGNSSQEYSKYKI